MVTNSPPPDDDDIDDDTLASFGKVLAKYHAKDPKWLTTLFPDFSPVASKPQTSADLTTFLQSMLAEEKTSKATMVERLEAAMSLMTPEQLTLLRSATGKKESGEGGPKPGAPLTPPKVPDPPPTKPKRTWL